MHEIVHDFCRDFEPWTKQTNIVNKMKKTCKLCLVCVSLNCYTSETRVQNHDKNRARFARFSRQNFCRARFCRARFSS